MEMVTRILALGIGFMAAVMTSHASHHGAEGHKDHVPDGAILAFDAYSDGRGQVELLLAKSVDGEAGVFHQHSSDGGGTWSEPVRVDHGMPPPYSPHRGMDPQIAAAGAKLIAVWTTAGTDAWGSGPMATALSHDGGRTWHAGPNPADDHSTTGHGFMDITADEKGIFHLTWLDSRDGSQGLRYSRSNNGGKSWSPNVTVKSQTCECCPNAIVVMNDAACILYRDRRPRDMRLAVSLDHGATWRSSPFIGGFHWQFKGCPHMGGGMVSVPATRELHVVVWTGDAAHMGIWHSVSRDRGKTWSNVERLGNAGARHPDLAASGDGRLFAVWNEYENGRFVVWGSSKDREGAWSRPVRLSAPECAAMQPRVVWAGEGFVVLWTEEKAALQIFKVK
jgi:hypothetical protein